MSTDTSRTTPDPSFFNGRFMVEIEQWNWALTVGLSHPRAIASQRFQGGLMYTRPVVVTGRIRAPSPHRGAQISVWISTFGRKVRFNARSGDVGRFYRNRMGDEGSPFEASLRLPEDALSHALICLSSTWKFLDIWTATNEADSAVTIYSFSEAIHPNIAEWAGPELDPPLCARPHRPGGPNPS